MLTIDAFQSGRPSQAPYVVECYCIFESAIVQVTVVEKQIVHGGKLFLSWVSLQHLDINALVISIDDLGCHHYVKNKSYHLLSKVNRIFSSIIIIF